MDLDELDLELEAEAVARMRTMPQYFGEEESRRYRETRRQERVHERERARIRLQVQLVRADREAAIAPHEGAARRYAQTESPSAIVASSANAAVTTPGG